MILLRYLEMEVIVRCEKSVECADRFGFTDRGCLVRA